MNTPAKRSQAEKIRRVVTQELKALGFVRSKTSFWSRPRGLVIEFVHLHLYSFMPAFRVHLGIRVLNDSFDAAHLNGPTSEHTDFRCDFDETSESISSSAADILGFIRKVGEPWFKKWSEPRNLVKRRRSPLADHERIALQESLDGRTDPRRVAESRAILGVA